MILEIILGIIVLLIVITVLTFGWGVGVYNTIKSATQDIKGAWSNVLTEYQRRADFFNNLISSTKGAMKFEKETLVELTKARSGNFGSDAEQQRASLKKMDKMFGILSARVEAYPTLNSPKLVREMQTDMKESEDRINYARTCYNQIVEDYNTYITMFPTNLLTGMFQAFPAQYFNPVTGNVEQSPQWDGKQ
jgi:LemA protein